MASFGRLTRTMQATPPAPAVAPVRAAAEAPATVPDDLDLGALAGILLRRWRIIAIAVVVGTSLGLGYALVATKTWRSTALVLVDPRDKQVVGQGVTQPFQGTDPAWVATQASLVMSEATLSRVVDELGLASRPDFGGNRDEAIRELAELVEVSRADETYVLDINVTTRSAALSASIAGALADAYVASIVDSKADSIRQATSLLGRQIDDLRTRAREAELALQAYKSENNLVAASGRMVDEERLRQLNDAFVAASVRAEAAKARSDRLSSALKVGRNAVDSALETADSPVLSRLKIEYALAQRSAAELARDLGPSHPRMQAVEANIERTRGLIFDELRSLASTAANDTSEAEAAERQAKRSLEAATDLVNRNGVAGVKLKELENEADVRREMYRSFVSRMEQTALQAGTQISDARVILPAQVPLKPYSPKRTLAVMLGFVAGLGLGLTAALYRGRGDLASARPIPAPPQAAETETARQRKRRPLNEIFDSLRDDETDPQSLSAGIEPRAKLTAPEAPATLPAPDRPASPTDRMRAGASEASVQRRPVRAPVNPADLVVLADVQVDTAPRMIGRSGRMLVRSAREIVASAVEDRLGRERPDGMTALTILADRVAGEAPRPAITVVFGAAVGAAAGAVAYGIARGSVMAERSVLLVDGSPGGALAVALCGRASPTLLDLPDEAAALIQAPVAADEGFDVIVAARGGDDLVAGERHAIAARIERIARGYRHTIVALGSDPDYDLMDVLAGLADDSLIVIDAAAEADPAAVGLIDNLAGLTPHLCGLVLVHQTVEDGTERAVA